MALSSLALATVLLGQAGTSRPADLAHDPRMIRWQQTIFWSAVVLLVFLIAAWAILRFSVRFRSYVLRDKSPPTPSDDVWSMHRVPKNVELGEEGPENQETD